MMNRAEMNEEMMAQINGGRGNICRIKRPIITPEDEPVVEVEAVGVDASEDDDSFWGRVWKLL